MEIFFMGSKKVKLFTLVLLLSGSLTSFGQTRCVSGIRSTYNQSDISNMEALIGPLSDRSITLFASDLCDSIDTAVSKGYSINEYLHLQMANYIGVKLGDSNYREKMKAFWNVYSEKFICRYTPTGQGRKESMHILKLIAYQQISYDFEHFIKRLGKPINVNDIETRNGKRETLLDYLESIENDSKFRKLDVTRLKEYIKVHHNAKRAREL